MLFTNKWLFVLQRISKRMWFRASLYCGLAVLTALVGVVVKPVLPPGLAERFGAAAVGNILSILATSMLAVTTFSLATMVSAYGTASQTATPRAARLLIEDNGAQIALATFVGAFLFSIAGLIALSTGIYGDGGRVVLFAATVAVIVLIIVTLLRWIEQLSKFGHVGETINLVEDATRQAMQSRARAPFMGGVPGGAPPIDGVPIESTNVGYVDHLDMEGLARIAQEHGIDIHVVSLPGSFAAPGRPLAIATRALDENGAKSLRKAFSVGDSRTFENDPRYGLIVLNEIAVRALSPAINDPGTCIDIIGTIVRLLVGWSEARVKHAGHAEVQYPHVHVPALSEDDMYDDVFPSIAREGAHMREIGIRLQKAFAALSLCTHVPTRRPVAEHARAAYARAMEAVDFEPDREAIRQAMTVKMPPGDDERTPSSDDGRA